jgi:hypothetical protein
VLRFASVLVLLVSFACGHKSKGPSDEATRFERGNGVARDYTRALHIHEDRCDHGDPVACRKLAIAVLANRGEPRKPVDAPALLTAACQHGDWLACVPPIAPLDPDKASAACDAGTLPACVAVTWAHAFNQSGTVEAEDDRRLERACDGKILEACEQLVERARNARETAPAAAAQVQQACDAGDADACDALGHPIAAADLCRANDFRACAATDDPAALERACDHRIADACEKLAVKARDADAPDPHVVEKFARACALGAAFCTKNWREDVPIGCAAYHPARVPADQRVHLAAPNGTDAKGAAWTAPAHPFLIIGLRQDEPPEHYAEVARRLSPSIAVYVIAPQGTDPGPYAPARLVVLDAASAAAPLAATTRPDPGSPLERRLGDGWPTIVDASFTPRAVLSLEGGIVPATLARCATGLLAVP